MMEIKKLKQEGQIFVPLTVSEAVLVNEGGAVITLDKVLKRKIEDIITPAGSGLNAIPSGTTVTIVHTNSIEATSNPQLLKVQYDNRGHITQTSEPDPLIISVNGEGYRQYNGNESINVLMGDDFQTEDGKIQLRWNNI